MPEHYPIGRQVPLPQGKRWVIGDIHGCHKTFLSLIHKIQLSAEDQLFLLGDFINKGPSNLKVLEEILHFKGAIFPLLGNHDKMFLDYFLEPTEGKLETLKNLNASDLLYADALAQENIAKFYQSLPYYYVSGDVILVHAGFNFNVDDIYSDTEAMIMIREFRYDSAKVSGRTIVHGHYPTPLDQIKLAVAEKQKVIPLDNGCVYQGNLTGIRNLLALELNEMKLVAQPNVDHT